MKRHKTSKLRLNRETLHSLDLAAAAGGAVVITNPIAITAAPCTNVLSICYSCTTPLDGCPPVYTSPAYTCA